MMQSLMKSAKKKLLRVGSCTLCAVMIIGCLPAYAIDDGVTPAYDEAYYATTDYYGNLTAGGVVKSYTTNGASTLTDYGVYDEIINLTDSTEAKVSGSKAVFDFSSGSTPEHFYFEGKTAKPFEQLPWTLSVHYSLNGVAAKAEDLAGRTGVVEITVDAVPNEKASEYARNNYTLEAMAVFNQDDIVSLEAPGAQVQLVGNLRAVLFIGLPGEEGHYTIRVGSNEFSFGGMTFLMVPATLSQFEEISKLSERKDDLEENYDRLSGSLDTLLDSLSGISGSLYSTASGLDQLNEARGTISAGKGTVYGAADAVASDLDALTKALEPVSSQMDTASAALTDTKAVLKTLTEDATSLRTELKELQSLIDDVQDHKGDVQDLIDHAVSMHSDLIKLQKVLNAAKSTSISQLDPLFGGMTSAQLQSALTQANALYDAYYAGNSADALTFQQFMYSALLAGGKTSAEATATSTSLYNFYQTSYSLYNSEEEAYEGVMEQCAPAIQAGLMTQEQAQAKATEAATAWATVDSMLSAFTAAGGSDSNPLDFEHFLYAALLLNGTSSAQSAAGSLYRLWQMNQADPGLTSVIIMEAEPLNGKVTEMNGTIKQVNTLLSGLAGPSAALMGDLAQLCADLNELDDLLDDADDFGDLSQITAKKCTAILDQIEALYKVLDTYEPETQKALTTMKDLSDASGQTASDTSGFLTSFESLLRPSGKQLDIGTRQTLDGLAAALRSTANSLGTTDDVKSAKNNISDIVEDAWNEYTGDANNLLLMDATAGAVSLTDERNAAPQSIQVLIRTQEIKAEDAGAAAKRQAEVEVQLTFRQRVGNLFKAIGSAIADIFRH